MLMISSGLKNVYHLFTGGMSVYFVCSSDNELRNFRVDRRIRNGS